MTGKYAYTLQAGNTNVKIGVFDGDNIVASWRMSTKAKRTADEYGMVLYDLLIAPPINLPSAATRLNVVAEPIIFEVCVPCTRCCYASCNGYR